MVAVVVGIIRWGVKVKKNVREKKREKRACFKPQTTRTFYSSRETICTTNSVFWFFFISVTSIPTNQTTIKSTTNQMQTHTYTHQEWRVNVHWTLFNSNQLWSWWLWGNGDLHNHQHIDWKSQFGKNQYFLREKTTKKDKCECFSFTINSLTVKCVLGEKG